MPASTESPAILETRRQGDWNWPLIAWLAVIVGSAFRFLRISTDSLWFDEGYTAWMVSHSGRQIIRLVMADTSPPLYYLLLHGWTLLLGHSEGALRSLSAVLSALTLLLTVRIARRTLETPAAVAAAVWAAALSFMLVSYAQEARCYALLALFCLVAFDCVQSHLLHGGWKWLLGAALALVAALYTHNMAIAYTLAIAPVWLVAPSTHSIARRLRDGLIAGGIITALYLPWAFFALRPQVKMVAKSFWVLPPTAHDITWILSGLCGIRHFWTWDASFGRLRMPREFLDLSQVLGLVLLVAAMLLTFLILQGNRRRSAIAVIVYALVPPIGIALYSCWSTPLIMDKVFLASASLLPIIFALPLVDGQWLRRSGIWISAAALILIAWSLWGYEGERQKEDWRGAARVVAAYPAEHRLIVFVANDGQLPFDYYYRPRPGEDLTGAPSGFYDLNPPRTMLRVLKPEDLDGLKETIDRGKYQDVVLVLSHQGWGDPENRVQTMFGKQFRLIDHRELWYVDVYRYGTR